MAHKLHAKFDLGTYWPAMVESYDTWTTLRLLSNEWQEYNLGYCCSTIDSDERSNRIVVVCYLFKSSRDLRRFKLWCNLHGMQVEDCSDDNNAKKNT